MDVIHQNHATLKRIEEVYRKKGKWVLQSGRIINKAWSVQTSLADNIITLGNNRVVNSYQKYGFCFYVKRKMKSLTVDDMNFLISKMKK